MGVDYANYDVDAENKLLKAEKLKMNSFSLTSKSINISHPQSFATGDSGKVLLFNK
jgi:hypothetical protein